LKTAALNQQRADGAARIAFVATPNGHTVLSDLYQRAPCRILFPNVDKDEIAQAVLLTTSGGLTGGDRIRIEVSVERGARVSVTAQAAEKLYRALPEEADTQIETAMTVGDCAWAEWLPQETILFNGSRLRRGVEIALAARGRVLAVESLVFGRTAMGERFDSGRLHEQWRIRRDGRLLWADALHLHGEVGEIRAAPFGFGTAVACSTLVYSGEDAGAQLTPVRRLLSEHGARTTAAATAFDGLLLVRMLASEATELRALVAVLIAAIRKSAAGLPPRVPRVWQY
jgi:urease accessory protein